MTRHYKSKRGHRGYINYLANDLEEAIIDVVDNIRESAIDHGIPRKTLGNKINGKYIKA